MADSDDEGSIRFIGSAAPGIGANRKFETYRKINRAGNMMSKDGKAKLTRRFAAVLAGAVLVFSGAGADHHLDTRMSDTVDSILAAADWRFVGPFRGGRVVAVAGSTSDPGVFYFGAAHGGVWKTTDAGMHWRNVSDAFFEFPSIGALDVSLSDPDVIYAGTGEGLQRQYISPGNGVYKSVDGGLSWTHLGLEDTRHISRLRIHPTNPDIVFVAAMGDMFGPNADRGVYRTTDGGKNWERVLYNGEFAGAVDLSIDHRNPDVILASLNHHVTYPWDEESGGPTTGLFRSADGGKSWTDITRNPGMPGGMVGKIGIAISPADSMRVYAFIEADEGEGGIYRSDDGGASWQMTHQDLYGLEIPNSYNHITADPEDPDIVYIQPISGFQKSVDGGHTFEHINHLNWDPHALWIDPGDPRRMIEGGDGGATVTLNGGETWSSLENQPTADLLSLAVDDQHPYWVYGAQNDNSHIAIPSATDAPAIGSRHYRPLPVGEGGQTAVTPDGQVIYANDRARMFRIDRDVGQAEDVSVWPEVEFGTAVKDVRYRFYYTFPILRSLHGAGTLYTAAQFVFRSNDEGQNWGRISPDLTRNRQDVMGEVSGGPISSNASSLFHVSLVRTIAESPL
ncbi:MAG: glycosyl hydrolase, partial [Gammaproteobacteria bacterium]|nr:glycosyl hydrolase [Gammaproteobacteria bacterium]